MTQKTEAGICLFGENKSIEPAELPIVWREEKG